MSPQRDVIPTSQPRRIVNMTISLEWLLGGMIVGVGMAATVWFSVQRLNESVAALTIAVNSGNSAYAVLAGKLSLLEYRADTFDAELKRLRAEHGLIK